MTAMKVVPELATDAMINAPRYLILYGETPGRTLEGAREHVLNSGGSIDSWPEWAKTETGHLNKGTLADLIWRMMLSAVEPAPDGLVDEELARLFHTTYESLADSFGYSTRPDTRTFDPKSQNGRLMIAVMNAIRSEIEAAALTSRAAVLEEAAKICERRAEQFDADVAYYHDMRTDMGYRQEAQAKVNAAVCRNDAQAIRAAKGE